MSGAKRNFRLTCGDMWILLCFSFKLISWQRYQRYIHIAWVPCDDAQRRRRRRKRLFTRMWINSRETLTKCSHTTMTKRKKRKEKKMRNEKQLPRKWASRASDDFDFYEMMPIKLIWRCHAKDCMSCRVKNNFSRAKHHASCALTLSPPPSLYLSLSLSLPDSLSFSLSLFLYLSFSPSRLAFIFHFSAVLFACLICTKFEFRECVRRYLSKLQRKAHGIRMEINCPKFITTFFTDHKIFDSFSVVAATAAYRLSSKKINSGKVNVGPVKMY